MQWVKTHLTVVICGSISLVALVMISLGCFLSDVNASLQRDAQPLSNLRSLAPVNEAVITHARQEQEETGKKITEVLQRYQGKATRQPLVPEVFTGGKDISESAAFRFQDAYRQALPDLLTRVLKANDLPNPTEIQSYENQIKLQQEQADRNRNLGLMKGSSDTKPGSRPPPAGSPPPYGGSDTRGRAAEAGSRGAEEVRANFDIVRAHEIYCYANLASLDPRPRITDAKEPASVEEMWYAQVALWIEQDVLGALGALNSKVADGLSDPKDRWVGNLPVKRLISFRLGNYVPPAASSTGQGGGTSGRSAMASSDANAVFTRHGCTTNIDVIRIQLVLVVDAQQLLEVMRAISDCKAAAYTALDVSYRVNSAASETRGQAGYVYGWAPVVEVTLDYEGCLPRSSYAQWMPDSVKAAILKGQGLAASGSFSAPPSGMAPSSGGSARPARSSGDGDGASPTRRSARP